MEQSALILEKLTGIQSTLEGIITILIAVIVFKVLKICINFLSWIIG